VHLPTLFSSAQNPGKKAKLLGIPHILFHVISFFSQNSIDGIKGKEIGDD